MNSPHRFLPERRALTRRELEVVRTYVAYCSMKEAATALGISERTVKNALYSARHKLGVESTLELALALRDDLRGVAPEPVPFGNIRCPDCGAAIAVRMEVAS